MPDWRAAAYTVTANLRWTCVICERCGKHRVARLLKIEGLRSQTGYRRRPGVSGSKPAVVAPNLLQRQFIVAKPNQAWVTDMTYIRTHEGWVYLAVVVDLFSR